MCFCFVFNLNEFDGLSDLGTLVMRPAGNDNKGAMKLRVDFKKKNTGNFCFLDDVVVFDVPAQTEVLINVAYMHYYKINPQTMKSKSWSSSTCSVCSR